MKDTLMRRIASLLLLLVQTLLSACSVFGAEAESGPTARHGRLTLSFDSESQHLELFDARTKRTWLSEAPALGLWIAGKEYRARQCEATLIAGGRGLQVQLSSFAAEESASPAAVTFEAMLQEQGVRFRLLPVQAPPESGGMLVDFPRSFGKTADRPPGYLVLPVGTGGVRPFSRGPFTYQTRMYANGSHGPNMAFLGKVLAPTLTDSGPAFLAVFHTPFDCRLEVQTRDFTPRWEVDVRPTTLTGGSRVLNVNYTREIEYHFLPSGRYTELAKKYRRRLQQAGRFSTLHEKLQQQPELKAHLGAVIKKQYSGPFFDNREIEAARRLGLKKCVWFVGGWNFGGGDRRYPQRLPPNPARTSPDGVPGEEGLRRTAALARDAGYVLSVHDNYSDAYEDSPEWDPDLIVKTSDGHRLRGGVWTGGQAWIICPRKQVELARRDLPRVREIIGRGGYFIDVTGAASPEPCFDEHHPCDRRCAAERKKELLALAKAQFGVVYTEGIFDFLIPTADGCHKIFIPSGDRRRPHADVIPVPLVPLIYHDAVILWDVRRENPQRLRDPKAPKYLPCGPYLPLYGCAPSAIDSTSKGIAEKMADAQLAEMVEHAFLEPGVERTTFADGTLVIANFQDKACQYQAHTIESQGFLILQGD